jgi:hypothetical protein
MLLLSFGQPLTVKPASASSPSKEHKQSISKDTKLVPDPNGVMMYDYGGRIGKVYNPKVVAVEGLR